MRCIQLILTLCIGLCACNAGLAQGANVAKDAQAQANFEDMEQALYAQRWNEAFQKLDPRNNIQFVLAMDDNVIEIDNVFRVQAFSRFLIVEAKNPNGKIYKSIVYPGTILLIRETAS